jgi:hypothetical protein
MKRISFALLLITLTFVLVGCSATNVSKNGTGSTVTIAKVSITPSSTTLQQYRDPVVFTAQAFDANGNATSVCRDGNNSTPVYFDWTAPALDNSEQNSNEATYALDPIKAASGTLNVTASCTPSDGSAGSTASATAHVVVTPDPVTMITLAGSGTGNSIITATVTDADGNTLDVQVTWSALQGTGQPGCEGTANANGTFSLPYPAVIPNPTGDVVLCTLTASYTNQGGVTVISTGWNYWSGLIQ